MKPKIYTDTSVIGGCLDIEFKEGSQALFERFKSNSAILMISSLTLLELEKAPQDVQNVLKQVPIENMEYIELSIEAKQLADKYLSEGVVSKKS
ncbi:MAG: hypothetical protein DRR16_22810 [Candidatus Parabeggiatoa sp. nov. 3]|nr:MAG: hypothetical protein DRR00_10085 [Gammaproteobacteria bacterium]RKZ68489.1 MAG: hypothetical protein DRQ99_03705 [Gammaproteobacteria bacterium]RKZ81038.1 MAG: hypothetical protein DRR16_22810 [Gammaproteobacteria bacterium]